MTAYRTPAPMVTALRASNAPQMHAAIAQARMRQTFAAISQSRMGLRGLGDAASDAAAASATVPTTTTVVAVNPFVYVLEAASVGLSAYHGYKRNNSVGWAIWWGLMGGLFPIITPAIGIAQGFGKRAGR